MVYILFPEVSDDQECHCLARMPFNSEKVGQESPELPRVFVNSILLADRRGKSSVFSGTCSVVELQSGFGWMVGV